jgi:hypothetical protein
VAASIPVKSWCVLLFAIFFSCYETQQLILETGTAIWWLTEPHCTKQLLPFPTNHIVHCRLGIFLQLELDEGKPAVLLRLVVDRNLNFGYVSKRNEGCPENTLVDFFGEAAFKLLISKIQ